jgi:RNA polymerase sigma-70 factor (ECF subfamily)
MQDKEEPGLIAQSLSGDKEAYGQLVDRYKTAIYYHCFAILHDEDAAEDIAQETFITAYYQLKKYNANFKFSTWLFKISTNKCLNYRRQKAKQLPANDNLFDSIVSTGPTPEEEIERTELKEAVARLEPKYRAVVSLYYWQGLAYKEIAIAMDVPINSVRVWLLRAKQQLRKELS